MPFEVKERLRYARQVGHGWCPPGRMYSREVMEIVVNKEVVPFTSSFFASDKDRDRFKDMRGGEAAVMHIVEPRQPGGMRTQYGVVLLAADYQGLFCMKVMKSGEFVRLVQAAEADVRARSGSVLAARGAWHWAGAGAFDGGARRFGRGGGGVAGGELASTYT